MQGMQEMQAQFLHWEDPLEEEMATHSSTLAWRIPWTEEPFFSTGLERVGHVWAQSSKHPNARTFFLSCLLNHLVSLANHLVTERAETRAVETGNHFKFSPVSKQTLIPCQPAFWMTFCIFLTHTHVHTHVHTTHMHVHSQTHIHTGMTPHRHTHTHTHTHTHGHTHFYSKAQHWASPPRSTSPLGAGIPGPPVCLGLVSALGAPLPGQHLVLSVPLRPVCSEAPPWRGHTFRHRRVKAFISASLEASWVFTWFLNCILLPEALLLGCFPLTQLLSSFLRFSALLVGDVSVHSLKQNCKWVFAHCGSLK